MGALRVWYNNEDRLARNLWCNSSTVGFGEDGEGEEEPHLFILQYLVYDVKNDLDCRNFGSLVAGGPFSGLFFSPSWHCKAVDQQQ